MNLSFPIAARFHECNKIIVLQDFDLVPDFANRCGKRFHGTFAADVHEINLRFVEKEMVVKRADRKAAVHPAAADS